MKHTIRLLAAPAVAMLILASCGNTEEETAEGPATTEEAPAEEADGSDSWPIVEDEDGNIVENPADQGAPLDDGGDTDYGDQPLDIVDEDGNLVGIGFGDDEQLEFDMDAAIGDTPITPGTRFYGASENGGDFVIATQIDPVEDLEAYREKAGGEPVTYMSVDIDNRDGTENINMHEIAVYDPAGNEYAYTSADDAANDWRDLLGSADSDTYNEGVELSNKYLNQGASPFERSTMILTGPELPDVIVAVVAMPRGAFEVASTIPLKD